MLQRWLKKKQRKTWSTSKYTHRSVSPSLASPRLLFVKVRTIRIICLARSYSDHIEKLRETGRARVSFANCQTVEMSSDFDGFLPRCVLPPLLPQNFFSPYHARVDSMSPFLFPSLKLNWSVTRDILNFISITSRREYSMFVLKKKKIIIRFRINLFNLFNTLDPIFEIFAILDNLTNLNCAVIRMLKSFSWPSKWM